MFDILLNFLFPPRCPACERYVEVRGGWCAACLAKAAAVRRLRTTVEERDTIAEAGRAGGLTGKDVFLVLFLVGQVAASLHEVSELIDCSGFVSRSRTQQDAVALEQISNTHGISPF